MCFSFISYIFFIYFLIFSFISYIFFIYFLHFFIYFLHFFIYFLHFFIYFQIVFKNIVCLALEAGRSGKTSAITLKDIRNTSVFRHHSGLIEGPLKLPEHHSTITLKGLWGREIFFPHYAKRRKLWVFLRSA